MKHSTLVVFVAGLFVFAFFSLRGVGQDAELEKLHFVGAERCKICHNLAKTGRFFEEWKEGTHAKSFDLLNDEQKKDPQCQKCHTTGFGMPGGFVKLGDLVSEKMLGVQCEMCHGPAEKHIRSRRGGKPISHPWKPDEKTCVKCHNPESPTWKNDRYTDEDGTQAGFIYKQAVKKVNHAKVLEALAEKSPKPSGS